MNKIRSGMMMVTGTGSPVATAVDQPTDDAGGAVTDPNLAFARAAQRDTSSSSVIAEQVGDLNHTILQGKVIYAVLETAINTDLPGQLRAIISRDIYPESGRSVMIPKGSRLIGTYNSSMNFGQKRIFIVWTRVIRPDGVDIAIDSPAVDNLGRAGVQATHVDNKFLEMFTASVLTSAITIGTAIGSESLLDDPQTSSTTNTDGSTTNNGSAGSEGVTSAVDNISEISKSVVDKYLRLGPTAYLDQGSLINVFVNKDLVFPPEVVLGNRFIQ